MAAHHTYADRGWIFVTPAYRLIPEATVHALVEDAIDAHQ
jgi:acetyl esterase/lipase